MALKILESMTPPLHEPVVQPDKKFMLTEAWREWFGRVPSTFGSIPNLISVVTLVAQEASIGATDFQNSVLQDGVYRASYRVQVTRAATVSSSLIVTFKWTDGGVLQTADGDAVVGNTVTTGQSDSILMKVDAGTSVQYSIAYVSVGATTMTYSFTASLERIST
jgi:hypothetical protein